MTIGLPPMLSRHAHLGPDDGACLMEYVSVLAGEPWSDRPRCTHPALALIARMVNDAISDVGRVRLLPFAPDLAAAAGQSHPQVIVHAAVHSAIAATGENRLRRPAHPLPGRRAADWLYLNGPARHALAVACAAIGRLDPDAADDALVALLRAAVDTYRAGARALSACGLQPGDTTSPRRAATVTVTVAVAVAVAVVEPYSGPRRQGPRMA